MKKILALVLSLAMVFGLASVVSAAPGDAVTIKKPAISIVVDDEDDMFSEDASFLVDFNWTAGTYYVDVDGDGEQDDDEDTLPLLVDDFDLDVIDSEGNYYEVDDTVSADNSVFLVEADEPLYERPDTIWLQVYVWDTNGGVNVQTFEFTYTAPEVVDQEIIDALDEAIASHDDTAVIDLSALGTAGVVTAADWKYITNTWFEGDWYANYNYLALSLQFFWPGSGTVFVIDADDLDYTWTKVVNFNETTGLVKYDKTEAEMYNIIRAITGDVKNPYVFGFAQYDKLGYTAVPEMTISKIIPQQWINYYGHKDLYLFAWDAGIDCDNWAHNDPKVLAETTLDAVTTTQRIEFSGSNLYKTLVLSKAAAEATDPDEETDDANPNTGANDIVNVAIVFAVISLAAAGAFVFKKESK